MKLIINFGKKAVSLPPKSVQNLFRKYTFMKLLEGKVAIVTGAARGIGKAIALKLASEGANIAFTDLNIDENA